MTKKTVTMIGAGLVVLILAGAAIFTALKLQESGTESVAPNAPDSKPKAQSAPSPTGNPVQLSFTVTNNGASPSPSPTASPTSSPAGATSAPTTAATATPVPTSSSKAPSTAGTGSPSTDTLPEAGMEIPTMLMFIGGGILLLAGIVLAS
jgi:hypothetical protein